MRRALIALTGVLALAGPALGAPASTTHYVGPSPVQVAADGRDVWVLFNDGVAERTLRRFDARTLRADAPVSVGNGGDHEPFRGSEFARTSLVALGGSAWLIDASAASILRVRRDGRVTRIPVQGAPSALALGPGGLWALDACRRAATPTPALPCDGRALLRIDPASDAAREERIFDLGQRSADLRASAPRELAVGAPGVIWVSRRLDVLSRFTPGSSVPVSSREPVAVLGRGRAALWSVRGCSLRATAGSGRVRTLAGVLAEPGRGCYPRGIAIGPRGNLWTVLATGPGRPGRIVAVNARTGRVEKYRDTGRDPVAVAAGAGGVWVVNRGDGTLTRYPTATTAPARTR